MASDSNSSSYNHREFDENFRRFMNICEKIINKKDELTSDLDLDGKGNPLMKCLHQYMRCYGKTDPDEREAFHVDLFWEIFNDNKEYILNNGHEDTEWLIKNNLILVYGSNLGLGNKSRIRIYLSHIFEMAAIMKSNTDKFIRENTNEDPSDHDELNYPDAYLLYLYRVFKSIVRDRTETAKLTIIISDLEEKLGLSEGAQSTAPGNGLDGLLQFATGMMGQIGLPTPQDGSDAPSGDDVGKALQNVFGNPKTQETISGMFKDMDKCDNIGDVIGKLVSGMSDPQFKDAIGDSLNGMADVGAGAGTNKGSETSGDGKNEIVDSGADGSKGQESLSVKDFDVPDGEIPIVSDD
jgi:hypothetical protein